MKTVQTRHDHLCKGGGFRGVVPPEGHEVEIKL
jgi:hypothetical protein